MYFRLSLAVSTVSHLLNDWGIVEGRAEAGVLETQSQR